MKISMLMLIYNECEFLPIARDAYFDFFDELIFVDMGSTDGSLEIIADCPAGKTRLVNMPRADLFRSGFAYARNLGAKQASGDWIFAIDADEVSSTDGLEEMRRYLAGSTHDLYRVRRHNYERREGVSPHEWPEIIRSAPFNDETHRRLYRRDSSVAWHGIVHEELQKHDPSQDLNEGHLDTIIHHLSAYRGQSRNDEKGGLYSYLILQAHYDPALRTGINSWWFDTYVPTHHHDLHKMAYDFCSRYNLDTRFMAAPTSDAP